MIAKIIKKIFGNSGSTINQTIEVSNPNKAPRSLTIHELSRESEDIVVGYRLSVYLLPRIPLAYLRRHGEFAKHLPEDDGESESSFCMWLPELDSEFDFLSKGSTMSSAVGQIPPDGGTFLPFLIALRTTIERPRNKSLTDYNEAREKTGEILSFGKSAEIVDAEKYLEILYDGSEAKLLEFVLSNICDSKFEGLMISHIDQLSKLGFESISQMTQAPDEVLLALKGIGPSRLEKIRSNNECG